MDVTERQLRAFLAVCDEGSITRAAARLFVSQPTLSRQLAALEQALGVTLIERLPRSARPTGAGRSLLESARAVVAAHDDLGRAVRHVTSGAVGELRIGTLYSLSLGLLPALLATWRSRHPQVQVGLHEFRHQQDLVTALLAGSFDVAIGPIPDGWPGGSSRLATEDFVVVLSGGAEEQGAVDIATLQDEAWVHFAPGNGLGDLLDAACARAGFAPRVALRTEQARAAVEYALQGLGHALVPRNVVPPGVATHALSEPVQRDVWVYWRGASDPLIRSLIASASADAG
ncbi:LysR family transcriptional regulator [Microbacterium sp. W4I20]|uniref:LysR family transcriptional regulator n=1 Tax=Microbacterium sp. W4I20 TaxID=3042262 RepID=UPI00277D8BD5|nr:LysR family transcriptional regulator [Microbacterium sp. W4I20]MDQ0728199.1 DNA-binding transcriptional LysR family regulator [Microbacterium sp. W4I20]